MDKVIYFNNEGQKVDNCSGQVYFEFLDYAFRESDYFMLVYVNYYGNGYSKTMKLFKNELKPFQIKSRSNPRWPGVLETFSPQTTYKIIFYKNKPEAKEVLKRVAKLSDWSAPSYPQDLAFFKGNKCWFYSVGHEKIAAIIHATDKDIDFVESKNLATREMVFEPTDNYFNAYDEVLESNPSD
ncbi:MAG: hypothetical protein IJE02_01640 [Clostridia bacterium]|nr:hypothetical protein [Clostridia bacterium]